MKPALRRIIRDERTLQFGVHPKKAVLLTDLAPPVRRWIDSLDGTRDLRQVVEHAATAGLDEPAARSLLDQLTGQGVLDDAATPPIPLRGLSLSERDRLRPDLDALDLASTGAGSGHATMARRRESLIRVHGAGRIGAQIVALLAAGGVGDICVVDPEPVRPEDLVPGGLTWAEVGLTRQDAAVAVARRATTGPGESPSVNAWTSSSQLSDGSQRPDLVVLAPVGPLDAVLVTELISLRLPHLLVAAFEGHGSVGPLVLPGGTACLHCLDLARRDRDPSWPVVTSRLGGYPAGEIACDTTLATLVAAAATGHALAHLDGGAPVVTNGTMDVLPDGRWKRRSWAIHPQCRCTRNDLYSLTMVTSAICADVTGG